MAKTFLERHKKKSVIALLLFLLRGGKGFGPLLLLVAFLSFLFIVPTTTAFRMPFGDKISRIIGVASFLGGPDAFRLINLEEALRAARPDRGFGWGSWLGSAQRRMNGGKSSIDMVRAGRSRSGFWGGEDGILAHSMREAGGKSISGIMDPEAARKTQAGVPLDEKELVNGLLANADAGMFGQGVENRGFQVSRAGMNVGSAVADGRMLQSGYGSSGVPGVGGGRPMGRGGKINGYRWAQTRTRLSGALRGPQAVGSDTDMFRLTITNAYSLTAALPAVKNDFGKGNCPEGNCPREYASNTSGVPFWGGNTVDGILAALDLNDPVPITPDGQLQISASNAAAQERQMANCEATQQALEPQLQSLGKKVSAAAQKAQIKCKSSSPGNLVVCILCLGLCGACKSCKNAVTSLKTACSNYDNFYNNIFVPQENAACGPVSAGSPNISGPMSVGSPWSYMKCP